MKRLTDPQKAYVVQELACYGTPKEVSEALMSEYAVQMAPQNVEHYDPTKFAGRNLAKQWRELFDATRKAFLEDVEKRVPEAHKAVRIRLLAHAARAYKGQRNFMAMAEMLERIAKEVGNFYTNRRELSGRNGKPIQMQEIPLEQLSDEELNAQLLALLAPCGIVLPKKLAS